MSEQRFKEDTLIMPRDEWMRSYGAAYFTYVQHKLLDEADNGTLEPATRLPIGALIYDEGVQGPYEIVQEAPSAVSLYTAAYAISKLIPSLTGNAGRERLRGYGISPEVHEANASKATAGGFVNVDFTHLMAPAVANEVTDLFVRSGKLDADRKNAFDLHDWAEIIGSGWFARLINAMAYAGFDAYNSYGSNVQSLQTGHQGGLMYHLKQGGALPADFDGEFFEVKEEVERKAFDLSGQVVHEERAYTTATIAKAGRMALRVHMQQTKSSGCPAAHHRIRLPSDVAYGTPFISALIKEGKLAELPDSPKNGISTFHQEESTIDRSLAHIASRLDQYQDEHGMPVVTLSDRTTTVLHTRSEG